MSAQRAEQKGWNRCCDGCPQIGQRRLGRNRTGSDFAMDAYCG